MRGLLAAAMLLVTVGSCEGTPATVNAPGEGTMRPVPTPGRPSPARSSGREGLAGVAPSEVPVLPAPSPLPEVEPTETWSFGRWHRDPEISFYGPGFYGRRTACGLAYTTEIMGVAHRSLPCGTLVQFRYRDVMLILPVIDRGPYVPGRTWDLSGAACTALGHCWTGPIDYRMVAVTPHNTGG